MNEFLKNRINIKYMNLKTRIRSLGENLKQKVKNIQELSDELKEKNNKIEYYKTFLSNIVMVIHKQTKNFILIFQKYTNINIKDEINHNYKFKLNQLFDSLLKFLYEIINHIDSIKNSKDKSKLMNYESNVLNDIFSKFGKFSDKFLELSLNEIYKEASLNENIFKNLKIDEHNKEDDENIYDSIYEEDIKIDKLTDDNENSHVKNLIKMENTINIKNDIKENQVINNKKRKYYSKEENVIANDDCSYIKKVKKELSNKNNEIDKNININKNCELILINKLNAKKNKIIKKYKSNLIKLQNTNILNLINLMYTYDNLPNFYISPNNSSSNVENKYFIKLYNNNFSSFKIEPSLSNGGFNSKKFIDFIISTILNDKNIRKDKFKELSKNLVTSNINFRKKNQNNLSIISSIDNENTEYLKEINELKLKINKLKKNKNGYEINENDITEKEKDETNKDKKMLPINTQEDKNNGIEEDKKSLMNKLNLFFTQKLDKYIIQNKNILKFIKNMDQIILAFNKCKDDKIKKLLPLLTHTNNINRNHYSLIKLLIIDFSYLLCHYNNSMKIINTHRKKYNIERSKEFILVKEIERYKIENKQLSNRSEEYRNKYNETNIKLKEQKERLISFGKKIKTVNNKINEIKNLYSDKSDLKLKINEYEKRLTCSMCQNYEKEYILIRCQHMFCEYCVKTHMSNRKRRCQICYLSVSKKDIIKLKFER